MSAEKKILAFRLSDDGRFMERQDSEKELNRPNRLFVEGTDEDPYFPSACGHLSATKVHKQNENQPTVGQPPLPAEYYKIA